MRVAPAGSVTAAGSAALAPNASLRKDPASENKAGISYTDGSLVLAENGKLTEVRTVIVPGLFDCEQTVENVSRLLAQTHSTATRYKIIRFRPMGVREAYKSLPAPTGELLSRLRDIAESYGLQDVVTV